MGLTDAHNQQHSGETWKLIKVSYALHNPNPWTYHLLVRIRWRHTIGCLQTWQGAACYSLKKQWQKDQTTGIKHHNALAQFIYLFPAFISLPIYLIHSMIPSSYRSYSSLHWIGVSQTTKTLQAWLSYVWLSSHCIVLVTNNAVQLEPQLWGCSLAVPLVISFALLWTSRLIFVQCSTWPQSTQFQVYPTTLLHLPYAL